MVSRQRSRASVALRFREQSKRFPSHGATAVDIKSFLKKRSLELMQDPKVTKLMQDERVMKVAMQAFQLRGKVQEQVDQNVEKAAKSLGLVTKTEAREL